MLIFWKWCVNINLIIIFFSEWRGADASTKKTGAYSEESLRAAVTAVANDMWHSIINIIHFAYRRFNAIVSQLKMHYFSEGAFESLIASQLLKKEKYIWSY